jgi:hypothetical protein
MGSLVDQDTGAWKLSVHMVQEVKEQLLCHPPNHCVCCPKRGPCVRELPRKQNCTLTMWRKSLLCHNIFFFLFLLVTTDVISQNFATYLQINSLRIVILGHFLDKQGDHLCFMYVMDLIIIWLYIWYFISSVNLSQAYRSWHYTICQNTNYRHTGNSNENSRSWSMGHWLQEI